MALDRRLTRQRPTPLVIPAGPVAKGPLIKVNILNVGHLNLSNSPPLPCLISMQNVPNRYAMRWLYLYSLFLLAAVERDRRRRQRSPQPKP